MQISEMAGNRAEGFRPAIDRALREIAAEALANGGSVGEAYATSLLAPGKRIRPIITVLTTEVLGGSVEAALRPACAVEMIHTASLIVDDIPCMDDANTRRGQPACHVQFGEDMAILTSIALLNDAYRVLGSAPGLSDETRTALIRLCTDAVGLKGLIGGQEKDLAGAIGDFDVTHQEKTGALFVAAAKAGAVIAGVTGDRNDAIGLYAAHLGLAFQTLDDFVDTYGSAEGAGKDVGQDGKNGNIVSMVGRDRAMKRLIQHVQRAVFALEPYGPQAEPLSNLARSLMNGVQLVSRNAK